jgi:phosphate/sulfate permease
MDLFKALSPVIPVFFLVVVGFIFANWKKISLVSVTEIIVYLCAPCLVFTALATKPLEATDISLLVLGAIGILAGMGLLVWVYGFAFGLWSRGFALPVLFMNAGNMGLPLALFAFGQPGLQRATLLFVIFSVFQYSLGIYILGGRGNWREIFRLPLIYATCLGLAFNLGSPLDLTWSIGLVAPVMALGGLVSAKKVAHTVSKRITGMEPDEGFLANLVTSFLVILASRWGFPVSTTHISCGALFGIGIANGQARWGVIRTILLAWLLTLPLAAISAALIYAVLSRLTVF